VSDAASEVGEILAKVSAAYRAWRSGHSTVQQFIDAEHAAIAELSRDGARVVEALIAHVDGISWPEGVGWTDEGVCLAALVDIDASAGLGYVISCAAQLIEVAENADVEEGLSVKGTAAIDALARSEREEVAARLREWASRITLGWDSTLSWHLLDAAADHLEADAIPLLLTLLRHIDIDVRKAATSVLAKIGEPAVAPLAAMLTEAITSPGSGFENAIDALARIGGSDAEAALQSYADDDRAPLGARAWASFHLEVASGASASPETWGRAAMRVLGPGHSYRDLEPVRNEIRRSRGSHDRN
jgi:hypothetical protein